MYFNEVNNILLEDNYSKELSVRQYGLKRSVQKKMSGNVDNKNTERESVNNIKKTFSHYKKDININDVKTILDKNKEGIKPDDDILDRINKVTIKEKIYGNPNKQGNQEDFAVKVLKTNLEELAKKVSGNIPKSSPSNVTLNDVLTNSGGNYLLRIQKGEMVPNATYTQVHSSDGILRIGNEIRFVESKVTKGSQAIYEYLLNFVKGNIEIINNLDKSKSKLSLGKPIIILDPQINYGSTKKITINKKNKSIDELTPEETVKLLFKDKNEANKNLSIYNNIVGGRRKQKRLNNWKQELERIYYNKDVTKKSEEIQNSNKLISGTENFNNRFDIYNTEGFADFLNDNNITKERVGDFSLEDIREFANYLNNAIKIKGRDNLIIQGKKKSSIITPSLKDRFIKANKGKNNV